MDDHPNISKIMRRTSSSIIWQLLFFLIALFLILPTSQATGRSAHKLKRVVLTNNHTNYLSVRCFSFDTEFKAQHLKSMQKYTFTFPVRTVFPSATMFNCSTNMGVFVAYKYDYQCADPKYDSCDWIYDEDRTYHWIPKTQIWEAVDYSPNYESLVRGGIIKGYYTN